MTTTTVLPVAWALIEVALRDRRAILVSYHGHERLVFPHALGWKAGRAMVLAYQTGGHTTAGALPSDPRCRWRCMYVEEVDHVAPASPAHRWQSADNYNPSRPFPAIDEIAVAITANDDPQAG